MLIIFMYAHTVSGDIEHCMGPEWQHGRLTIFLATSFTKMFDNNIFEEGLAEQSSG